MRLTLVYIPPAPSAKPSDARMAELVDALD